MHKTEKGPAGGVANGVAGVLAACLAIAGVAGLLSSFASLATAQAIWPKRISGSAEQWERFSVWLRATGGGLLVCSAALWLRRDSAAAALRACAVDTLELGREAVRVLRRHPEPLLGVITLAGAALRGTLLFQPVRPDEAFTYLQYASRPLPYIVTLYTQPNNHILHTILVHFSTLLFGPDVWAIRLPGFVAGVLVIPALYFTARNLFGREAALIAAGLAACNTALIEYSVIGRGYTLLILFFLCGLLALRRAIESDRRRYWVLFAGCSAAGMFTVPTMLYAIAFSGAWLILEVLATGMTTESRKRILLHAGASAAAAGLITAALYLPAAMTVGPRALVANRYVSAKGSFLSDSLAAIPSVWEHWNTGWPWPLAAGLAMASLLALARHGKVARHRVPLAAGIAGCVLLLLVQRVAPFRRVWLFLAPVYLMTAAAGIAAVIRMTAARQTMQTARAAAMLLAAFGAWSVLASEAPRYSQEGGIALDAREITRFLKPQLRDGDVILAQMQYDYPLRYYFARENLSREWFRPGSTTRRVFAVIAHGFEDQPDDEEERRFAWQTIRDAASLTAEDTAEKREVWRSRWAVVYEIMVRR